MEHNTWGDLHWLLGNPNSNNTVNLSVCNCHGFQMQHKLCTLRRILTNKLLVIHIWEIKSLLQFSWATSEDCVEGNDNGCQLSEVVNSSNDRLLTCIELEKFWKGNCNRCWCRTRVVGCPSLYRFLKASFSSRTPVTWIINWFLFWS